MSAADDSRSPPTVSLEGVPREIGRYRVLERLGAGGMGAVYKAHDPQLDRTVAIKIPLFDVPRQNLAERIQRFQREARAAAQVWHPHVCPIYDVGEQDGQPYVVMAYVEGRPLSARLAAGRFEHPAEAVTLVMQLLEALDEVHARGIIHRDFKPGNVMLDAAGRAILMDFGLARPEQTSEHLTSDGIVLGTPSYMAPEQAAGLTAKVGPWTDLYSVGVVLYQMLTGRLPFEGPPLAVLGKIVHEPPPPPRELRPDLDAELEKIVLRALEKDCEARYQTAREFAQALRDWPQTTAAALTVSGVRGAVPAHAGDQTISVNASGLRPTPQRFVPRRLPKVDVLTAALLILAGIVLFVVALAYLVTAGGPSRGFGVLGSLGLWLLLLAVVSWVIRLVWGGLREDPQAALLRAAENGQVEQIKKLIRRGVPLESRDEMGETALMKAAHKGYINTVKLLIANGADVSAKNPFGETALSLAVREGRAYIAELLRQAGAKD